MVKYQDVKDAEGFAARGKKVDSDQKPEERANSDTELDDDGATEREVGSGARDLQERAGSVVQSDESTGSGLRDNLGGDAERLSASPVDASGTVTTGNPHGRSDEDFEGAPAHL
jgi:hypothetical protein